MKEKNMSFEEMLGRLSEIAELMGKDNIPLEESLKLYEEGVMLADSCEKILTETEQKIKVIRVSSEGELAEEEMPNDAES